MTELDANAFRPQEPEANQGRYQVQLVPFGVLLADLSLPAAGAAAVTADTFLAIPGDQVIDRIFIQIIGTISNFGIGTMVVSVVQDLPDGLVEEITAPQAMDGSDDDVLELPLQRERIELGRPLYLRITASTSTGGGTPWYLSADLQLIGTIHFYLE